MTPTRLTPCKHCHRTDNLLHTQGPHRGAGFPAKVSPCVSPVHKDHSRLGSKMSLCCSHGDGAVDISGGRRRRCYFGMYAGVLRYSPASRGTGSFYHLMISFSFLSAPLHFLPTLSDSKDANLTPMFHPAFGARIRARTRPGL